MDNIESRKRKKINDIVSVVKLAALLFSVMIFLQYFSATNNSNVIGNNNIMQTMLTVNKVAVAALLVALIYLFWSLSATKYKKSKQTCIIEDLIFTLLFSIVIIRSGAHVSEYKFIFIFIIITSTIQYGAKHGMILAIISSVILLSIDLIYGSSSIGINQSFENDLIMAGVFLLTTWPLGFYVNAETQHIKKLEGIVNLDGLTGVYNHRYFHESLSEKVKYSEVSKKPISMIFLDIDYFKHYNDLYGHQQGDVVLKTIGRILTEISREQDIVARYGGEEFAVILPDTDEKGAIVIAENIRRKIEKTYFEGEENQPKGKLTASIGISVYPDKAKDDMELIKSADDALYRAKFFNKNRVETYTSILDELTKDIDKAHIDLITSIKTLISVINAKDKYTYGHVERVVIYANLLADKLKLTEEQKKDLKYSAYIHDIGKINISREVLIKKMPLDNEEWEMLKNHPKNGVEIIKPVESLQGIAELVLHHHERFDGRGYPNNLKGEEIPYLARVLTVIDSFDAMTSNRPYNKRKTYDEAVVELEKCSGTQFDPEIAKAFIEVIREQKECFDDLNRR